MARSRGQLSHYADLNSSDPMKPCRMTSHLPLSTIAESTHHRSNVVSGTEAMYDEVARRTGYTQEYVSKIITMKFRENNHAS